MSQISLPDQSVAIIDPATGRLTIEGRRLLLEIIRKLNTL